MLPDVEPIYDGEPGWGIGGDIIGATIRGHVEDDVAVPLAWSLLDEYGASGPVDRPRRVWVRKVPCLDWDGHPAGMTYQYLGRPARGATPMTVVETSSGWHHTCALCPWEALIGYPVNQFADPVPPTVERPGGRRYVYLCESHAAAHDRDYRDWLASQRAAVLGEPADPS